MNILTSRNESATSSKTFLRLLTLFFGVLLVLAVLLFETHVKKDVISQLNEELTVTNQRLREVVNSTIFRAKADIRFLHSTPPISGLPRAHFNDGVDPYDGTSYKQWKERLETIFIGFMENNLHVEQLRIIAVTATGEELIRVQRRGAAVEAVPDYSLQPKSGELYFLPSSQLEVNQVYLAPMSLNREFAEVTFPYKPMLRLSIPIYSEQGKRFAFLIMNVNANELINKLVNTVFDYSQLIISSSEGDIIYHPNEKYRFSRDLAPDIEWETLYQQPVQYHGLYLVNSKEKADEQFYVSSERVQTRPGQRFSYVDFSTLVPKQYIDNMINNKRLVTYSLLLVIVFFTVILLIVFQRNANRSQMLAEIRRESSAIVDGSIDAIIGLNLKGQLTSLNFTAERLLSTSKALALGEPSDELPLLQQLPVQGYICDLENSTPQIKDERSVELNGQSYCFAISISPVLSEQGGLNGLALVIRDISKEKAAEVKVKRLNLELESKVRSRTQDLAEAKDLAIKNSDIKSAFISNISHELRTPLNGVIGTLNILKREQLPETPRKLVTMMELSATNLNLLINDILDLSKIEAGKLDLNEKAFNPQYLIESLAESCAIMAFDKELDVYVDTQGIQCEQAISDPLRLTQIINNLMSNAVKFTEHGFIKIKAETQIVEGKKHTLNISIEDTGLGIDDNTQQYLFKAFHQANSSVAGEYGGTGLGLSICKKLCQMMGGDIEVSSILNQGSTFSFNIIIETDQNIVQSKHYLSKKVLLVNSNKACQEQLSQLFVHQGASVEIATLEELERPFTVAYDIVFLDSQDNRDGLLESVIDEFRSHDPNVKIVILCKPAELLTNAMPDKVIKINKPITHTDLLKVIGITASKVQQLQMLTGETGQNSNITAEVIQQITGCRILIVDDNDINIAVAAGALDFLPIKITTANNGEQAIAELKLSSAAEKTICCILMDCQMPVLNGYNASEKIRAGGAGNEFIDIPIIAMTANAMMGEKEKCIAAGMNDFISKPIDAQEAQNKVIHWALTNYENNDPDITLIQAEQQQLWDQDAALSRLLNKQALLVKICSMFIKAAPEKFAALIEFIDDNNYEQVRQVAHSLKGLCGEVSANRISGLFAEIELQASNGQLNIAKPLSLLKQLLPELLDDMAKWLEKHNE